MGGQRTFASMAWSAKGKVTRRERFLAEMDAVIPWRRLLGLIEPHYPKSGKGGQPLGLEQMLRICFLQQWFNLSDPQAEDAIYDSESMRRFARADWATTWRRMRRLSCASAICWRSTVLPVQSSRRLAACSKRAAFCCAQGPSSMRPSSQRPVRPKTPARRATAR
jgi:hypothetical protein